MTTGRRTPHTFTPILSGDADLTDAVCDALFEAGCDDALAGLADGVAFPDFAREAGSMREAVLSADLDGDGRIDIVAVGRATHNARIYWNKGSK